MADVRIPDDLWNVEDVAEGIVANWFYREGAKVEEGATIAELMVEKTRYDITAPASGTLHVTVDKDGVVVPGTVIGRIEEG